MQFLSFHFLFTLLPDASDADHKKKVLPIQLRVINVLKKWVEDFFDDFDEQLIVNLKDFLQFTVEIDHPIHARTLSTTIDAKLAARMNPHSNTQHDNIRGTLNVANSSSAADSLDDMPKPIVRFANLLVCSLSI